MQRNSPLALIVLGTGLFVGCNGDNHRSIRGTLLQDPPTHVTTISVSDLLSAPLLQALASVVGTPKCQQIDIYSLQYHTVGGINEATTGSGALMVPSGTDSACQGSRPILLYAHGTENDRSFDIAAINDPQNLEGPLIAALFAANGYIVVAPNYAGYATSTLGYHPYLNADQQSKDMIDALTAARRALPVAAVPSVIDSGKLFITGYSQGGYVAMATHRALQAGGAPVTASAPLSGTYALAAFGDAIFQGQVDRDAPLIFTFIGSSYQRSYGIYTTATDFFEPQFATGIETLVPSTIPDSELSTRLPQALFSSTPPAPEFAPNTPATMPSSLASVFAAGFGEPHLITNAFRLDYLRDSQMNPDRGFPANADNLPPASPANPLRAAFKTNDLRNWAPTAPMLLCGGNSDPVAFYMNTQLIQGYFSTRMPTAPVTVLDVDSAVATNDPFATIKQGFAAIKSAVASSAQGATDDGASAVLEQYHELVAPFCLSAAREFFADK